MIFWTTVIAIVFYFLWVVGHVMLFSFPITFIPSLCILALGSIVGYNITSEVNRSIEDLRKGAEDNDAE